MTSPKLLKVVRSYLNSYSSSTSNTRRAKQNDLDDFLSFLTEFHGYSNKDKLTLSEWTKISTKRYFALRSKVLSTATLARRLATLKHLANQLTPKVFVDNPTDIAILSKKSIKRKKKSFTSHTKIAKKITVILTKKSDFKILRSACLALAALELGVKPEELRQLTFEQVDLKTGWIVSIRSASGTYRNISMSRKLLYAFRSYNKQRLIYIKEQKIKKQKNIPFFLNKYGSATNVKDYCLGSKSIWRSLNELKLGKNVNFDYLRKLYIKKALSKNLNLQELAKRLGYTSTQFLKVSDFSKNHKIDFPTTD